MTESLLPAFIPNWIAGEESPAASGKEFEKPSPATGRPLCRVARSGADDIDRAVAAAHRAQPAWADTTPVGRGQLLHALAERLDAERERLARIVAAETGKSVKDATGEVAGAVALGRFFAGEGQRLYGRTTTSGVANRQAMTVREPIGVAGLIAAANTPIANIAWKAFPALICGNGVVLKPAEDAPATAWYFGRLARDAGLPPGVLDIVQGFGEEAGAPLVAHRDVGVISFTGSTAVGLKIQAVAGQRMARISLELGGKNPFVVCDDADLDHAVRWAVLSAFSNAGQRCASASRIIVFDSIYERFRLKLFDATARLRVGPGDDDDLGPVINERQLARMIAAIDEAKARGVHLLIGGRRMMDPDHRDGCYLEPALLEGADPKAPISTSELFGPIAVLYRAKDFADALRLANDAPYGLTACIHTRNLDRAWEFCRRVQAGVAVVNAGTYGSEPHMPFGGRKLSGNGTREPGTEAIDVYSELKDIYITVRPEGL